MVRNCDGPLDPGPDAPEVPHFGIPPVLWTKFCPFRTLLMPDVHTWVQEFARFRKYKMLPAAGGVDDQAELTLQAFDVMDRSLMLPLAEMKPRVADKGNPSTSRAHARMRSRARARGR